MYPSEFRERLAHIESRLKQLERETRAQAEAFELIGALSAELASLRADLDSLRPIDERPTDRPPPEYPWSRANLPPKI